MSADLGMSQQQEVGSRPSLERKERALTGGVLRRIEGGFAKGGHVVNLVRAEEDYGFYVSLASPGFIASEDTVR